MHRDHTPAVSRYHALVGMKIAIGADHRGGDTAVQLAERLRTQGHEVVLHVPAQGQPADYPDAAYTVGHMVADGRTSVGVLICGTGVGMSIAANKIKGVRAAAVHDEITAQLSRSHNDANIICLSADLLGVRLIEKIIDTFIATSFEGGRHARRVDKIRAIEEGRGPGA